MPRFRPGDHGFRDPRTIELALAARHNLTRIRMTNAKQNAIISRFSLPDDFVYSWALDVQDRHHMARNSHSQVLSANHGQLFAIKDNIVTQNAPTTCASHVLHDFQSPADATIIRLMRDAGMIPVLKTNMDEFGMGSHSLNSAYGPCMNGIHHNQAVSAGGSSGGSALAVADDLCPIALGTDTGGSVRLPAAYLRLVGFKPSYGLISRNGVVPYANSLDTVGILAKSCLDVFLTFQVINQPDPKDPTCLSHGSRRRIKDAKNERLKAVTKEKVRVVPKNSPQHRWKELKEFQLDKRQTHFGFANAVRTARRIGVPLEYNIEEMHPLVRRSWTRVLSMLRNHGHEIVPISLPSTKHALSAYYVIAPAEASSNLAKYDGVRYGRAQDSYAEDPTHGLYSQYRGDFFGEEVKRRILLGSFTLSASAMDNYFIQAQKVRRKVQDDFNHVFRMRHPLRDDAKPVPDGIDFIICPTAPTPPPQIKTLDHASPIESYMNDVFTVPASLAGLPAISIPAPREPSLPEVAQTAVGIQVIGQYGDDYALLGFAKNEIEKYLDQAAWRHITGQGKIR